MRPARKRIVEELRLKFMVEDMTREVEVTRLSFPVRAAMSTWTIGPYVKLLLGPTRKRPPSLAHAASVHEEYARQGERRHWITPSEMTHG